jgi:hypothetical protein
MVYNSVLKLLLWNGGSLVNRVLQDKSIHDHLLACLYSGLDLLQVIG